MNEMSLMTHINKPKELNNPNKPKDKIKLI
jgi:hypothetical protein